MLKETTKDVIYMELDSFSLENALMMLGQRLTRLKQHYEVVAIGGGSLVLLGYIDRTTKDLDLVAIMESGHLLSAKPLPKTLLHEIKAIGSALGIGEHWVNAGPSDLLEAGLPEGFEDRLISRNYANLTIHFASRLDQIYFKLYASVDQGSTSKHFVDLQRLNPTKQELLNAKKWYATQDASDEFSSMLTQALHALGAVCDSCQ